MEKIDILLKSISTETIVLSDETYQFLEFDKNLFNEKNKLIFCNTNIIIPHLAYFSPYYNTIYHLSYMIFCLDHLSNNGILIVHIQNVAYKHIADLILIIAQFFTSYSLYQPEIHHKYKSNGTNVMFKNFKGLSDNDRKYLFALLVLLSLCKFDRLFY